MTSYSAKIEFNNKQKNKNFQVNKLRTWFAGGSHYIYFFKTVYFVYQPYSCVMFGCNTDLIKKLTIGGKMIYETSLSNKGLQSKTDSAAVCKKTTKK